MIVQVLTHYIGDGLSEATAFRPAVSALGISNFQDVTNRPRVQAGQRLVAQYDITAGQQAQIEADPNHGTPAILTTPGTANATLSTLELINARTFLVSKGITLAECDRVLGTAAGQRTRRQIAGELALVLRDR